jgi:hypothetical protein
MLIKIESCGMELNKFKISAFKGKKNDYALLTGELSIPSEEVVNIEIPSQVGDDSHIVLPNGLDSRIFEEILRSPLTKNKVYFYDQDGNCFSRLEKDRATNAMGELRINISNKSLIRNIKLPNIPEGEGTIYLVLNTYPGAEACKTASIRTQVIREDLKDLPIPPNLKLITTPKIWEMLISGGITPITSADRIILESDSFATQITERFFGKKIADSYHTYQNILQIGPNWDCLSAITDSRLISITTRSRGRIQINSSGKSPTSKFMIIVKKEVGASEGGDHLKITDDKTGNQFTPVVSDDIKLNLFLNNALGPTYEFYSDFKIAKAKDIHSFAIFVNSHSSEIIKFLYLNPLKMEGEDKTSLLSTFVDNLHSSMYSDIMEDIESAHTGKRGRIGLDAYRNNHFLSATPSVGMAHNMSAAAYSGF